ncbi:hypothetical protein ACOBR2_09245 [Telmatobacter bradus]|uniref:hypothetical protein n=1 Tax=Telmatobacter bradus TaxID=474953 RepID=UPI003B43A89C
MRTNELPLSTMNRLTASTGRRWASLLLLTVLVLIPALHGQQEGASTATPATKAVASTHKSAAHKKAAGKKAKAAAKSAEPAPETIKPAVPVEAPKPDWPANDPPKTATVSWNASGLRIEAQNASLKQILNDVETATGTSIDGLGKDERVFGTFGPGPARDVLTHLLEGTGYNIVMVGDQGGGNPRQIELTLHNAKDGGAANAGGANNSHSEDDDADVEPEEPQQPPAGHNGANGGPNGAQGNGPGNGRPPMQGQTPPPGQNSPQ